MAIGLVNREVALARFGAVETGKLSLAADLSFRLFVAFNFLPETVLFQIAMRREATGGPEAATRQIHLNQVYALAIIAPIALGYMAMAPTFEALLVPRAFRGDFVVLSRDLAPGFLAYCAIYAICNPLFQLARKTWPITLAALAAFLANLALAAFPPFSQSVEGLALAHSGEPHPRLRLRSCHGDVADADEAALARSGGGLDLVRRDGAGDPPPQRHPLRSARRGVGAGWRRRAVRRRAACFRRRRPSRQNSGEASRAADGGAHGALSERSTASSSPVVPFSREPASS